VGERDVTGAGRADRNMEPNGVGAVGGARWSGGDRAAGTRGGGRRDVRIGDARVERPDERQAGDAATGKRGCAG
jgi:hypothetical protein